MRLGLTGGCLLMMMSLVACKGDGKLPDAMPAGYERVDAAFGFRPAAASFLGGQAKGPVVEFRAKGDYALYPLASDCSGNFSRGPGMVFAADGSVREQLLPQDSAKLSVQPQFKPVVDKLCTAAKNTQSVPSQMNSALANTQDMRGGDNVRIPPKFADYPAPPLYSGPPGKLLLDSDFAKEYRSRLTEAMSDFPVFAGEYVITGWGCGTGGCYVQALVNKRTGKAIETTFGAHNVTVDFENGVEERVGEAIEAVKANSSLLVTREVTQDNEGNPQEYFAKFYVIDNGQLKLIKKIAIPKPTPVAN